ncbi:MAG: polysaccharide deacetylase family protein [Clostridia bacterium]|nr:polysaccharide deacetylase family protein [Clostridia bacterium]
MKRLNRKITIVTNVILLTVFTAVFAVSFFAEDTLPIYGGHGIGAVYHGNRENNKVSLMFNVYENSKVVNSIIDTLEEYDAKATFFVGGCWADDNAETLTRILNSGNEIANHGYFHKDHKNLDYEKNKEEIYNTGVVVKALCGADMNLFAPPSGSFSSATLEVADSLGYKVIMWSKDTIDWRDKDVEKVFSRATKDVTNGDLILMHPKEHTLTALPKILEYYKSVGLKVVTVSDNLS